MTAMMKKIISLLCVLLLVIAAGAACAENPPADPPAGQAEETLPEQGSSEQAPSEVPPEQVPPEGTNPEQPPEGGAELPGDGTDPLPEENPDVPGTVPASPTDLCPHSNTKLIYFFDSPEYQPLDEKSHRVSGPALAEIKCSDCGAVISTYKEPDATEIRPHAGRKGRCPLCGWEANVQDASGAQPRETVRTMAPEEELENQFFCTLTAKDLEKADGTLVLRPDGFEAALALQTRNLADTLEDSDGSLTAELGRVGSGALSASIRLYDAYGFDSSPENQDIFLRIYTGKTDEPLSVTYTNSEGDSRTEPAAWQKPENSEGFWSIPWLGDGTYGY